LIYPFFHQQVCLQRCHLSFGRPSCVWLDNTTQQTLGVLFSDFGFSDLCDSWFARYEVPFSELYVISLPHIGIIIFYEHRFSWQGLLL
jgi:hypothetical protein